MTGAKNSINIIILGVICVSGFLFWYISKYSNHAIHATAECTEIFKEKSAGYFGDYGSSRFVFNKKMNTCLILNINDDKDTGDYRLITVDMITDEILFYYELPKGENIDKTMGLTKEEALNRVRTYGFVIF